MHPRIPINSAEKFGRFVAIVIFTKLHFNQITVKGLIFTLILNFAAHCG